MEELVLYRSGDGVVQYVEISEDDLWDDDKLSAFLAPFKDQGFSWVPDFR